MRIAGLQKLTLLDFPGHTAATIFTPGCRFRCGFCHNPELVRPEEVAARRPGELDETDVLAWLQTRRGLLDGVCITGGDPTLQPDLEGFMTKLKGMDFLVKLDTNGADPDLLARLYDARLLDYVAMDVKASPERYPDAAGVPVDLGKIERSRDLILDSGVEYEFRTTVVPGLHDADEVGRIGAWLRGATRFAIQNFSGRGRCVDASFEGRPSFTSGELEEFAEIARAVGIREVLVRE